MNATDQSRAAFAALAIRVVRTVDAHCGLLRKDAPSSDDIASRLAEIDRRGRALRRIHLRQVSGYVVRDGRPTDVPEHDARVRDCDEQAAHEAAIAAIVRRLNPYVSGYAPIAATICADPKRPPIEITIEGRPAGVLGVGKEG